jgi:hypothetical protein
LHIEFGARVERLNSCRFPDAPSRLWSTPRREIEKQHEGSTIRISRKHYRADALISIFEAGERVDDTRKEDVIHSDLYTILPYEETDQADYLISAFKYLRVNRMRLSTFGHAPTSL